MNITTLLTFRSRFWVQLHQPRLCVKALAAPNPPILEGFRTTQSPPNLEDLGGNAGCTTQPFVVLKHALASRSLTIQAVIQPSSRQHFSHDRRPAPKAGVAFAVKHPVAIFIALFACGFKLVGDC